MKRDTTGPVFISSTIGVDESSICRVLQDFRQRVQSIRVCRTLRAGGAFFHRRREILELCHLFLIQVRTLSALNRLPQGCNLICGQSLRPLELIDVCLRYHEVSRPLDLWLVLNIQLSQSNRSRSIDLVLRNKLRRRQLKDVQTAGDF